LQTAELKKRALGAAAWALVRTGGDQLIRFTLFVYLARVLTPADFGVFAVATIIVDYGRLLSSAGLNEAIIQAETADDELLNTIFWSLMGLTVVVASVLAIGSPLLASFSGVPAAQPFMAALAGCLLLGPLASVHATMAVRNFKNKKLTARSLIASAVGAAAALVSAYAGLGLWSLIVQQVVGGVLSVVVTWIAFPWRPRLQFSIPRLRTVWRFSGNLLLARALQMSVLRVQSLLAARFLGPAMLGQFRIAGRSFELLNMAFISPVSSAALPTLARLQSDPKAFNNAYARMISLCCLAACPVAFGFAAVSQDAVPLIFGARWMPAVPAIQMLALLSPATVLAAFAGPALAAQGRTDVTVKFAWMQLIGTTIFSLIAVRFGIVALAGAYVLRSYLTLPVQLRLFGETTGMPIRRILGCVAPSLAAAAAMACAVVGLRFLLTDWLPVARMAGMIAAGGVVYAGVLFVFFRRFVQAQFAGLDLSRFLPRVSPRADLQKPAPDTGDAA